MGFLYVIAWKSELETGGKVDSLIEELLSGLHKYNIRVFVEKNKEKGKDIVKQALKEHDLDYILKEGMVFTIEPIICLNKYQNLYLLPDKWSIISPNNPSSQFEHTVMITKNGCEILTLRPDEKLL